MMNFADRLLNSIDKKQNPSVVGLDPRIDRIPRFIKDEMLDKYGNNVQAVAESFFTFNKGIIEAVSDIVPVVKPQMAFYEKYGVEGVKCFLETVNYAKSKGLIVIEDAKRNDIGSTAIAYSNGHIGKVELCRGNKIPIFDVDAITVNPYLGSDGIKPFINDIIKFGKGCFVLVKTSNPSSKELQDKILVNKKTVFEIIGKYVDKWGKETRGERGYQSVGAVVGATFSKHAETLRKIMKRSIFLSPGYGAQGARAEDVLPLFNKDGYGAIISSSRKIIFAYQELAKYKEDRYIEASKDAAIKMREDINDVLKSVGISPW